MRETQMELVRKQRRLDDQLAEVSLQIEKGIAARLVAERAAARKDAAEAERLKLVEKDAQIASMRAQIEALKQKAEQGSQQAQGEAMEVDLEATLRGEFPRDSIAPVPKGEHGGDVIQTVLGPSAQVAGKLLWESKRTRNWSDSWLAKARENQRAAHAYAAVIVTQTLPKGVDSFAQVDGVWVCSLRAAVPLATALRQAVLDVTASQKAQEGQQTKMALVYEYISGPRFHARVAAVVEAFEAMHEDLVRERKVLTRLWAKREQQLRAVIGATAGMFGDVQGVVGKALSEIEGLDLQRLDEGAPEGDEEEAA